MLNRPLIISTIFVCLSAGILRAQPANDLPTIDQLKSQLATDPKAVNLAVSRLLAMKGAAAAEYDHYDLLMLRGEASLRAKSLPQAADAFAQAQKATTDMPKKHIARANELLVRKSKPAGYTPSPAGRVKPGTKPPEPMPINEEADRKAAMNVFVDDQLTALQPMIAAAKNATALPKIVELATALDEVRVVDQVAAGKFERTEQPFKDIAGRANDLIGRELARQLGAFTEARDNADRRESWTDFNGNTHQQQYTGLDSTHQAKMRELVETCAKIEPLARWLGEAADNDQKLSEASKYARDLGKRGKDLLEAHGAKSQ